MEVLTIDPLYQKGPLIRFNLSFQPYLHELNQYIETLDPGKQRVFFENIRDTISNSPLLCGCIPDPAVLDPYKDLLDLMELSLFPLFPREKNIEDALGLLSPLRFFSYSDGFRDIVFEDNGSFRLSPVDEQHTLEENYRMIYREILKTCYGIEGMDKYRTQMLFQAPGSDGMLTTYYRFSVNKQFATMKADGEIPALRQEWVDYANEVVPSWRDLETPIDISRFMLEGFFIFTLSDVTEEEAFHILQENVANMHTQPEVLAFENIKKATSSFLGSRELEIGMIPFVKINNRYVYDENVIGATSILFRRLQHACPTEDLQELFGKMALKVEEHAGYMINNNVCNNQQTEIMKRLAETDLQSIAVFPVWNRDSLLGIVELGGTGVNAISGSHIRKMERAMPLYREFLVYQMDRLRDRMESFIRERYTAIQPAVSWKFNEIAWTVLRHHKNGRNVLIPPVRFDNLYPFYGAVDIRNSSQERLFATRSDFSTQLLHLSQLLRNVTAGEAMQQVDDMLSQIRYWQAMMSESLTIEQEAEIQQFLDEDSIILIYDLKEQGQIPAESADNYVTKARNGQSLFHGSRNSYERSMQDINEALKKQLNAASRELQQFVPHYFEKFKTDGWEYNLYAGQSIAPWQPFDTAKIPQIIDWQLRLMVKMAIAAKEVKQYTLHQLATTQLILAHMHPVDINFRTDERRFDVEGAYSIRYEVIKKRIDKAYILDTNERLTQPGTIAVVYAHSREAAVYRNALQQLIGEGWLLPEINYLELEKLQGVSGLKALRVAINMDRGNQKILQGTAGEERNL
ncbi:hypothetical protein ACTHGU_09525 [Chitinophagaceae bacterium MMS25-I14]